MGEPQQVNHIVNAWSGVYYLSVQESVGGSAPGAPTVCNPGIAELFAMENMLSPKLTVAEKFTQEKR